jgi:hypothetical protein
MRESPGNLRPWCLAPAAPVLRTRDWSLHLRALWPALRTIGVGHFIGRCVEKHARRSTDFKVCQLDDCDFQEDSWPDVAAAF